MVKKIKGKQAIALQYDVERDHAPRITAAGQGMMAERILERAEENDVAIYHDERLVKELIEFKVGTEIPTELYEVVAQVLVFIENVDQKKGAQGKDK
ncbi:flagellar biosynthesis protein [Alkaliphilus metalliredigens QYMF]|uniref:Flagellar biosynthesis protein n=1 Tax=Alkaliphilus metalliredigens (strain QYMF) TaxID=293826 RepID=A6TLF1_ALKMQ|nr:EscU/YscU/HrcU family type III secretion system export apparatus switch protein [Alkaliphilus metalliredigens]ABR47019.1 flagellar biosynthesis protein [Alkaliphilus metalliredigens QYMF]